MTSARDRLKALGGSGAARQVLNRAVMPASLGLGGFVNAGVEVNSTQSAEANGSSTASTFQMAVSANIMVSQEA